MGRCGGSNPRWVSSRTRYVWIDIFAVRQWPSKTPDLDFASTIAKCTSFLVVCSSQTQVENLKEEEFRSGNFDSLDKDVRRQICFMRVWCLVEAHKACSMSDMPYNMPYILKGGSYCHTHDNKAVQFKGNFKMLKKLQFLVNLVRAEATVASDKEKILKEIKEGVGFEKLNSTIRGSIIAAGVFSADNFKNYGSNYGSIIQCAACGDKHCEDMVLRDSAS